MNSKSVLLILFLIFTIIPPNVFAQSESIETEKSSYGIGETVTVSGNSGVSNAPIAIEVKDSEGQTIMIRSVNADSEGNYNLQFKIPSHATPGNMDIITTTDVLGTPKTQTKQLTLTETSQVQQTQQTTSNPEGGGCLIATAAFGSELAPEIQSLREIRDNTVLQTALGKNFITSFNQFYYTFSPLIADYERENPFFKETVKILITPMLKSLSILHLVDIQSDTEMMFFGSSIILLNAAVYLGLPTIFAINIKNVIRNRKVSIIDDFV